MGMTDPRQERIQALLVLHLACHRNGTESPPMERLEETDDLETILPHPAEIFPRKLEGCLNRLGARIQQKNTFWAKETSHNSLASWTLGAL